jgi:outer membrane beta-barrel protein
MTRVKLLPGRILITLSVTAFGASLFTGAPARAERRNPLENQPAIRHRKELRRLRLEITPNFATSINQDYKHAFGVGGNIEFHILDWLAIGFEGEYLFNTNTALEDQVRSVLDSTTAYRSPGPRPTLQIHDQHVLRINATLSPFAQVTPFSGKFSLFSALFFHYDLYAKLGVGLVNYVQDGCCLTGPAAGNLPDPNLQSGALFAGLKIGGMVGVGVHVYFNEWLGMQLELRDYIVGANPGGLDVNGDRCLSTGVGSSKVPGCSGRNGEAGAGSDETVQNNIFFGVGLTFMLPPTARTTR